MAGFHFEHHLPHQNAAVAAVLNIFNDIGSEVATDLSQNPIIPLSTYIGTVRENIRHLQKKGDLQRALNTDKPDELVFDISMETGTGKTYAYTKTMFELNKHF
jgi:type III restriction enzyme